MTDISRWKRSIAERVVAVSGMINLRATIWPVRLCRAW